MATIASSGSISFSSIQAIMGGTGAVSMSQYKQSGNYARGVSGVSDTNVNIGSFAGKAKALNSGLMYRVFTGTFNDVPTWFDSQTETNSGISSNFSNINTCTGGVVPNDSASWYGTFSVDLFGFFYATVTGSYTFYTNSDDMSYLWIGSSALSGYTTSNCIVNNGGGHGTQERSGSISLTASTYYPILVQQSNTGGPYYLSVSFTAPGISRIYDLTGYVFFGLGTNSSFPANHARLIKAIASTNNVDGQYYINVNGTSTPTYCLMNSKWDGGGWMMLMKANTTTVVSSTGLPTFTYNSTLWTDTSTTLNTADTTRNVGDAKFNIMNYGMIKDVMASWPDVGYTGGSISQTETWTWLMNNYYSSGTRCTAITGFSAANTRDTPSYSNPYSFPGFSTSIWSAQGGAYRQVFGSGLHLGNNGGWTSIRWGFAWNNEADFTSNDVCGGIGMYFGHPTTSAYYSAGDKIGCCQSSTGLNRAMRVELYGR